MTKTFLQLQKQIAQLQNEADKLRRKEAQGVLSRIKEAINVYGFTAQDLGVGKGVSGLKKSRKLGRGAGVKRTGAGKSGPSGTPKFKDASGNVWGGRGPRPQWFKAALDAGKTLEELRA